MGDYTELNCALVLRRDTPEEVIAVLKYLQEEEWFPPEMQLPQDPFFTKDHWKHILSSASYYFAATEPESSLRWDKISLDWRLTIRTNMKNYDGEIEAFLDWLSPYFDMTPGAFLGYIRFEYAEVPTLVYHEFAPEGLAAPSYVPSKPLIPYGVGRKKCSLCFPGYKCEACRGKKPEKRIARFRGSYADAIMGDGAWEKEGEFLDDNNPW